MAVGIPIVAARLDGFAEVLCDGEDSALVAEGDRDGFVARMGELIDQPALAKARAQHSAEAMTRPGMRSMPGVCGG